MKILIFLIFLAAVVAVVMLRVRKADAEKDLARQNAIKHKQVQRKEAITPEDHVKWPVIIQPAGNAAAIEDEELPEPTMTSIEFERVDHPSLQH